MSTADFSTSILVEQTPRVAFDAINNVRGWWSEQIEGGTSRVNDIFNYHYKDVHLCKIQVTELEQDKKIVWFVLDNYFSFINDKTEWKGTKMIFDISEKNGKTLVKFTHQGLTPSYECYEICEEAWTNYIQNSLRKLIQTGVGEPSKKEVEGFNASLVEKWMHKS